MRMIKRVMSELALRIAADLWGGEGLGVSVAVEVSCQRLREKQCRKEFCGAMDSHSAGNSSTDMWKTLKRGLE